MQSKNISAMKTCEMEKVDRALATARYEAQTIDTTLATVKMLPRVRSRQRVSNNAVRTANDAEAAA